MKVKVTQSCASPWTPVRLLRPWNSLGKNIGVSSCSLFQGIFPTQGLNLDLLHCRHLLYHLSHQGDGRGLAKSQRVGTRAKCPNGLALSSLLDKARLGSGMD